MKRAYLAGAVALALASGAQAATYDAFTSFDGTQGAGGFTYLKLAANIAVPLASAAGSCVVPVPICLQDSGNLPGAYKSGMIFKNGTYTVPDDRLLVHPGSDSAIGIFFNAAQSGTYDYTVSFNVVDDSPSGVALIRVNTASGAPESDVLGGLGPNNLSLNRTGSITLQAGQSLGFIVNNAGNYSNDSTGFRFTLTSSAIPEPASWATMIGGLALTGACARRRGGKRGSEWEKLLA